VIGFALGLVSAGCYTLKPASSGALLDLGSTVAFDINDFGRLSLGGTMGPEMAQIEGRLVESGNGEHVLAVTTVRLLRGGVQVWSGEKVRLRAEYVGSAYARQLSKARTVALGAAIGGVTAYFVARNLIGAGSGPEPGVIDTTGVISLRARP
jgi:hypothetical protein